MTNPLSAQAFLLAEGKSTAGTARTLHGVEPFPVRIFLAYCAVAIAALLLSTLPFAKDYVGADNDDVMRLVVVRDLLAGQGWFDTTQYRLGLDGGTSMHWSRFIDLPIANLIAFFSLFLPIARAEAVALALWPTFLVIPFFYGMGLAGLRLGGRMTMHATLFLSILLIMTMNRFQPGSIDHHNVQFALIAIIVAMLLDPAYRRRSLAIAGLAAGFAIAIGAETMPLIAAVCAIVSILWVWHGERYGPAARAFGLSLAATVSGAFFITVPPSSYGTVTCDNLSLGFYPLATLGGGFLFLASAFFSKAGTVTRGGAVGGVGLLVGMATLVIAPQCLQNPLSGLDPMLVELWLNGITEAQSVVQFFQKDIQSFATFYAVGFLAIAVCLYRIARSESVEAHIILLALIGLSYGIGLVQVRATVFANILATIVMARAIIDVRALSNANPKHLGLAIGFIGLTLASVPGFWAITGLALPANNDAASETAGKQDPSQSCEAESAFSVLAGLPPGLVVAPSDSGAEVLRFTPHRTLSAPYHRNQGGMLTELHIGLAKPVEAEAFLRGAGVTVVAFCPENPQTWRLAKMAPEGLYAQLAAGRVPSYLQPLANGGNKAFQLFTVKPR